ncbi:amidohydrolase family protein [Sporosarcina sp. Sa2YVA2]|uniref:Amidohydrolase family protein n=1 Tax=Sporosarcina quadrami TaxID=2762234 RepID=A0ABR8UBJ6_9BACL|nr:amidohydrolase [Sporosarcina quadrami]MBD7985397.1 amidohydrolase family protein [Sporosarcina quadrami]
MTQSFWLTNVILETGFIKEDWQVVGTKTGRFHIRIEDAVIAEIKEEDSQLISDLPTYDCRGLLLLPSFEEGHIHLDKTYFGGPWHAVKPIKSIFDRIEEEKRLLPKIMSISEQQAEKILAMIQGFGTTHVRAHCNIEPVSGLRRLEATRQALESYSGKLSSEIVAFPQHGLLYSDSVQLMKEAMAQGATYVGGLDPNTVDGDMETSLQTMVELAVAHNAGIDIHLHESGEKAKQAISRLADLAEEAGLHGKVTISHAFWFANADKSEAEEMAERLAALGMSIASTVPIGRMNMPLPMLHAKGVDVKLGTDSLTDHWSPFGNGDQLEKAGRFAEVYGYSSEVSLAQSLGFITGGITPLNEKGEQVWPKVQDAATFLLVDASCSAEAIARRSTREAVWYKGKLVYEKGGLTL